MYTACCFVHCCGGIYCIVLVTISDFLLNCYASSINFSMSMLFGLVVTHRTQSTVTSRSISCCLRAAETADSTTLCLGKDFLTTHEVAWYIILVVSVCLSDNNFWKPWRSKFIFAHAVYLRGLRVEFVYEGRRVKVNVAGTKKVENFYSHNVKLRSAITPVLSNRAVMFACSMGFSGAVDRIV